MHRAERPRSGAVLLEVIVAMAILGTVATAVTTLAVDAGRLVRHARASEAEVRAASAFLTKVALWERDDLDRHLGDHAQGAWRMTVVHRTASLYDIAIRDSATSVPMLRTVLYRPTTAIAGAGDAKP
jgi:type II secretory pathway pseudopilin PulG